MQKPTIPPYSKAVKAILCVIAVILLIDIPTNFIPVAWLVPVLILVIIAIWGYKAYHSFKQGCRQYGIWQIAEMALLIAGSIILLFLYKRG